MCNGTGIQINVLDERFAQAYSELMLTDVGIDLLCGSHQLERIHPDEIRVIGTGLSVHFGKPGYAASVYPDQKPMGMGHAVKTDIIGANHTEEIEVTIHNRSNRDVLIRPNERIARLVFHEIVIPDFEFVSMFGHRKQERRKGSGRR